jgi:hypothetical protein
VKRLFARYNLKLQKKISKRSFETIKTGNFQYKVKQKPKKDIWREKLDAVKMFATPLFCEVNVRIAELFNFFTSLFVLDRTTISEF